MAPSGTATATATTPRVLRTGATVGRAVRCGSPGRQSKMPRAASREFCKARGAATASACSAGFDLFGARPGKLIDALGRVPEVLVDQVAIEVHRHCCRGVPQYPLHHLGIRASTEPDGGSRVPRLWTRRRGFPMGAIASAQADRALPGLTG